MIVAAPIAVGRAKLRPGAGKVPMRFALMIEAQQGLTYVEQLGLAQLADRLGYETFFRSDHYRSFPGPDNRSTTDAWTVLAGLARETTRIRLGALVSPVTFRHPGSLAKIVTTVDEMSGGRVELGVGAGWNEAEHLGLGLAFPAIGERADLLEDELAILHGLWEQPDGWSYEGHGIQVAQTSFHPKPVQVPHPPMIMGGEGSPRSIRLAARYADEYNMSSSSPERCAEAFGRLEAECVRIGRDPSTMTRSVMAGLLIGSDAAEMERRSEAQLAMVGVEGKDSRQWLDARLPRWVAGTPDQARAVVASFATAGVQRIMLQDMLPRDHAMIELVAQELFGRV
jgi:F420-dependent oxidoreductase-like protein